MYELSGWIGMESVVIDLAELDSPEALVERYGAQQASDSASPCLWYVRASGLKARWRAPRGVATLTPRQWFVEIIVDPATGSVAQYYGSELPFPWPTASTDP